MATVQEIEKRLRNRAITGFVIGAIIAIAIFEIYS
jgi:ABC-type transport system involved in cytochrome c biogenesis permease subunit